jgi:hypothetical protein
MPLSRKRQDGARARAERSRYDLLILAESGLKDFPEEFVCGFG